jgi:hypothetical protein
MRLGEEVSKLRRHSAGLTPVVGPGVPRAAEYDLPGVRQYRAEPIERGPQVAGALGATKEKDVAEQLRKALEWPRSVTNRLCVISYGRDQLSQ